MSDNKFTESMEVEAVGNLKPGDIGWGTCDGCEKNIHKFPGVLLQGVSQEASKLLFEKVEVVPVGTTERLKNLEGINDSLVAAIKAVPGKPITEDWVFAEVEKGFKAFSEKYKELKASNNELLEALEYLIGQCEENERNQTNFLGISQFARDKAIKAIQKARGLQQ